MNNKITLIVLLLLSSSLAISYGDDVNSLCFDTDNTLVEQFADGAIHNPPGDDRYNAGLVEAGSDVYKDFCATRIIYSDGVNDNLVKYEKREQGEYVLEQACLNNSHYEATPYDCPFGCSKGRCLSEDEAVEHSDMDSCLENPLNYWDQETDKCYPDFSKQLVGTSCVDPDGGDRIYEQAHTFGFRSAYADDKDKRIRTGGKDACFSDTVLVEHYCDPEGYIQTAQITCPEGCTDGACKGKASELTEELVKCIFTDSVEEQECYSFNQQGQKFSCTGQTTCVTEIKAGNGEKLTWKSSCSGEYSYTLTNGENKYAYFNCQTQKEILPTAEKYSSGYWQCYDGTEQTIEDTNLCLTPEQWEEKAKKFCKEGCNPETAKCGINKFEMSNKCLIEKEIEEPFPLTEKEQLSEKEGGEQNREKPFVCQNNCLLDDKCYPFGHRKNGEYCSAEENKFIPQRDANLACDNNFECQSNICVSGQCVSPGLVEKIISWFRSFLN